MVGGGASRAWCHLPRQRRQHRSPLRAAHALANLPALARATSLLRAAVTA